MYDNCSLSIPIFLTILRVYPFDFDQTGTEIPILPHFKYIITVQVENIQGSMLVCISKIGISVPECIKIL